MKGNVAFGTSSWSLSRTDSKLWISWRFLSLFFFLFTFTCLFFPSLCIFLTLIKMCWAKKKCNEELDSLLLFMAKSKWNRTLNGLWLSPISLHKECSKYQPHWFSFSWTLPICSGLSALCFPLRFFSRTVLLSAVVVNLCWVCNWDPKREVKRHPLRKTSDLHGEREKNKINNPSHWGQLLHLPGGAISFSKDFHPLQAQLSSVISSVCVFLTPTWFWHWFLCLGGTFTCCFPLIFSCLLNWCYRQGVGRGPFSLPFFLLWFHLAHPGVMWRMAQSTNHSS